MKGKLSLILTVLLVFSSLGPVLASDYENAGNVLSSMGVLKGNDETGDLMLEDNLTRQDMVVLVSRLYNQENIARNHKGNNIFVDLNAERQFYIPYIIWSKDRNLIEGIKENEFGYGLNTSVQEFQTVLLRVLEYNTEASNWNKVPEYSETLGLMNNLDANPNAKLTRGQMAQMVLNALDLKINQQTSTLAETLEVKLPEVFKANLKVDKNKVSFDGRVERSRSLEIEIKPKDKDLEPTIYPVALDEDGYFSFAVDDLAMGKYEYRLIGDNHKTIFKGFEIEEEDFEFLSVTTNNLREINLNFSKPLDPNKASSLKGYRTNAGEIAHILFEDENHRITLKLREDMIQDKKYTISADGIYSMTGLTMDINNEEFISQGSSIPELVNYNAFKNNIIINFNKEMDKDLLFDHTNYYMDFNGEIIYLPKNTKFEKLSDTSISINLPEYISGTEVMAGQSLKSLDLRGMKDSFGNDTDPLIIKLTFDANTSSKPKPVDFYNNIPGKTGVFLDRDTIQIKFNVPILQASIEDFYLRGIDIKEVIVDETNIVTIKLNNTSNHTSILENDLSISNDNKIKTAVEMPIEGQYISLIDKVKPLVVTDSNTVSFNQGYRYIYIPFSEQLETEGSSLYARDISLFNNKKIVPQTDYETSIDPRDPASIRLTLKNYDRDGNYSLSISGNHSGSISYIKDIHGNPAEKSNLLRVE